MEALRPAANIRKQCLPATLGWDAIASLIEAVRRLPPVSCRMAVVNQRRQRRHFALASVRGVTFAVSKLSLSSLWDFPES